MRPEFLDEPTVKRDECLCLHQLRHRFRQQLEPGCNGRDADTTLWQERLHLESAIPRPAPT